RQGGHHSGWTSTVRSADSATRAAQARWATAKEEYCRPKRIGSDQKEDLASSPWREATKQRTSDPLQCLRYVPLAGPLVSLQVEVSARSSSLKAANDPAPGVENGPRGSAYERCQRQCLDPPWKHLKRDQQCEELRCYRGSHPPLCEGNAASLIHALAHSVTFRLAINGLGHKNRSSTKNCLGGVRFL